MAFDLKWWHAQVNLAWRVLVHYGSKLWPWRPRFGLQRFQENYVHEGLPPATPAFRAIAHQPGRCTQCGVCDEVCPVLRADGDAPESAQADTSRFLGPMAFVASGARAAPHFPDIEDALAVLTSDSCGACRACDAACPERIPILALAGCFEEQRRVVEDARRAERERRGGRALPAPQ